MKIWTDDEYIEVDPNDVGQLEAAMLFKAEHIKAKADPELFAAVAEIPPIICCSNCDWATGIEEKNFQHFPNCGAKMDGGAIDGTEPV